MALLRQLPVHRMLRNPNYESMIYNRAWEKSSPYENTLTLLEDPSTNRKLYLIGTTNSSTQLANRTRRLIEDVKPDEVFVNTCLPWHERARNLTVENQEQFNELHPQFRDVLFHHINNVDNRVRGIWFKTRFYAWAFVMHNYLLFPADFNPLHPGLETKWALDSAEKVGAKINYLGGVFNPFVTDCLTNEHKDNFVTILLRHLRGEPFSRWRTETDDYWTLMRTHGGAAFSENLDAHYINWFVQWYDRISPAHKKIFVDSEDDRIFLDLFRSTSKNTVAVVNHWHLPGIEHRWRNITGTNRPQEFINPIGDMNIDEIQEAGVLNDTLRAHFSKLRKSEPAAWANYFTHYHKSVMEPERERHVFFEGYEDSHMSHGLFNEENSHVKNLPESFSHGHH